MTRTLLLCALLCACSHEPSRPRRKDLAVRISAPESPLLRDFSATLARHGVRLADDPRSEALDLVLRYDIGPGPVRPGVLPRDGQFTLEVRQGDKLLQTLESPDQFCFLRPGTLRDFYACHADRLSYDFLNSDATRELPGGPPPPPPPQ